MRKFSEFLQYGIDKCGFTYRTLSERTGIEHPIIYRMLHNDQIPTLFQYIKILNCITKNSNLQKGFTHKRMLNILEKQLEDRELQQKLKKKKSNKP